MGWKFRSSVAAALLLWAPFALAASAPAEAVRAVYEQYRVAEKTGAMGPDQLDPKLYTPRVRAMIAKLQKACKGKDICLPDADFLVDGQDFKITDLLIRVISEQNGRAMIEATFKNFDTKVKRIFTLRESGGRWLIDNIDFGGGQKLKDQLKPNP